MTPREERGQVELLVLGVTSEAHGAGFQKPSADFSIRIVELRLHRHPIETKQLRAMWKAGYVTANARYWCKETFSWRSIAEFRLGKLAVDAGDDLIVAKQPAI
jgi:hypothetical protein